MSKVIILNGPAGCGKDTVGRAFAEREGYEGTCFKEPMFRIAATTLGMDYHEFYDMYQDREWKEAPNERLNGHTVRELMIQISEAYIKPFMGSDYFGQQAVNFLRLRPWQRHFLFTDGGFAPEMEALVAAGHEVILVHMYRDGCTFEGDSRSYVLTNSVPRIYTLTNNGTIDEAVDALGRILDSYDDLNRRDEPEQSDDAPVARARPTPRGRASGRRAQWEMPARTIAETLSRIREREAQQQETDEAADENFALEAAPVEAAGFEWDSNGEPITNRSAVQGVSIGNTTVSASNWVAGSFGFNPATAYSTVVMDEVEPVSEGVPGTAV